MRSTNEPAERDLPPLGAPIRKASPAPTSQPTETPGILRQPDGRLETQIPVASQPRVALQDAADDDLPDGLSRLGGRLVYRCPRCERDDAEYFGDDPADFDPTWPCGGSQWCLP